MPIIHQLAALYPSTKFVSIVSDHCIENYPDKNCPTMLVYRAGAMMGQIVGLGAMGNDKATLRGKSDNSLPPSPRHTASAAPSNGFHTIPVPMLSCPAPPPARHVALSASRH